MTMMQMKDLERFLQILNKPVRFGDVSPEEDEAACSLLLEEFNEAETNELACSSYAFWIVQSEANGKLPPDAQSTSALREIRRHYVAEDRNHERALLSIQEALEYRREYHFDLLRSCFYPNDDKGEDEVEDDVSLLEQLLLLLLQPQEFRVNPADLWLIGILHIFPLNDLSARVHLVNAKEDR